MHTRTAPAACAALAALSLAAAPPARAQTYTETGDAGQTVATAQNATTTTFTRINGTIAPAATDADLYRIYISSPGTFSASTVNAATTLDTALFLFDATGHGVATNDDANGTTLESALPAGNALYKNLPAGFYILGISLSGNEPTNGPPPNQLLFNGYPGGDTTAVRGPASGLNPTTEGGFDSQVSFAETGPYQINLTGVSAAPEPSQAATLSAGLLLLTALALTARKRRRA